MKYEICYVLTSAEDFIAAIDPNGDETVKIMDAMYFPYFRNEEGEYDIKAISEYINAIEDISSWEDVEEWHTVDDVESRDGDYVGNEIIFSAEVEI